MPKHPFFPESQKLTITVPPPEGLGPMTLAEYVADAMDRPFEIVAYCTRTVLQGYHSVKYSGTETLMEDRFPLNRNCGLSAVPARSSAGGPVVIPGEAPQGYVPGTGREWRNEEQKINEVEVVLSKGKYSVASGDLFSAFDGVSYTCVGRGCYQGGWFYKSRLARVDDHYELQLGDCHPFGVVPEGWDDTPLVSEPVSPNQSVVHFGDLPNRVEVTLSPSVYKPNIPEPDPSGCIHLVYVTGTHKYRSYVSGLTNRSIDEDEWQLYQPGGESPVYRDYTDIDGFTRGDNEAQLTRGWYDVTGLNIAQMYFGTSCAPDPEVTTYRVNKYSFNNTHGLFNHFQSVGPLDSASIVDLTGFTEDELNELFAEERHDNFTWCHLVIRGIRRSKRSPWAVDDHPGDGRYDDWDHSISLSFRGDVSGGTEVAFSGHDPENGYRRRLPDLVRGECQAVVSPVKFSDIEFTGLFGRYVAPVLFENPYGTYTALDIADTVIGSGLDLVRCKLVSGGSGWGRNTLRLGFLGSVLENSSAYGCLFKGFTRSSYTRYGLKGLCNTTAIFDDRTSAGFSGKGTYSRCSFVSCHMDSHSVETDDLGVRYLFGRPLFGSGERPHVLSCLVAGDNSENVLETDVDGRPAFPEESLRSVLVTPELPDKISEAIDSSVFSRLITSVPDAMVTDLGVPANEVSPAGYGGEELPGTGVGVDMSGVPFKTTTSAGWETYPRGCWANPISSLRKTTIPLPMFRLGEILAARKMVSLRASIAPETEVINPSKVYLDLFGALTADVYRLGKGFEVLVDGVVVPDVLCFMPDETTGYIGGDVLKDAGSQGVAGHSLQLRYGNVQVTAGNLYSFKSVDGLECLDPEIFRVGGEIAGGERVRVLLVSDQLRVLPPAVLDSLVGCDVSADYLYDECVETLCECTYLEDENGYQYEECTQVVTSLGSASVRSSVGLKVVAVEIDPRGVVLVAEFEDNFPLRDSFVETIAWGTSCGSPDTREYKGLAEVSLVLALPGGMNQSVWIQVTR